MLNMEFSKLNGMLSERIKQARADAQLTQDQLAACVGVTKSAVSQWEGGNTKGMKPENIFKAAECLKVDPEWLATGKHSVKEIAPAYLKGGERVPLISWVQAGHWCEAIDNPQGAPEDWLNCPVPCSKNTFALKVHGISMEPRVKAGEIIFVDPEVEPVHGNLVVVRIESTGEATFKQLVVEDGKKMLKALNPDWPEKFITIKDDAIICGVVIFKGESMR